MAHVHHRARENTVSIRGDDGSLYTDTVDNLKRDTIVPFPPLPDGIDERVYERGVRHALNVKQNTVDGGEVEKWDEGDALIADLPNLIASKAMRLLNDQTMAKKALSDRLDAAQQQINADLAPAKARALAFGNLTDVADLLNRARTASDTQIDQWFANNVTNLAQARGVLASIVKLLVARRVV